MPPNTERIGFWSWQSYTNVSGDGTLKQSPSPSIFGQSLQGFVVSDAVMSCPVQFQTESEIFASSINFYSRGSRGSVHLIGLRPPLPIRCGEGIILWDDFQRRCLRTAHQRTNAGLISVTR